MLENIDVAKRIINDQDLEERMNILCQGEQLNRELLGVQAIHDSTTGFRMSLYTRKQLIMYAVLAGEGNMALSLDASANLLRKPILTKDKDKIRDTIIQHCCMVIQPREMMTDLQTYECSNLAYSVQTIGEFISNEMNGEAVAQYLTRFLDDVQIVTGGKRGKGVNRSKIKGGLRVHHILNRSDCARK